VIGQRIQTGPEEFPDVIFFSLLKSSRTKWPNDTRLQYTIYVLDDV
jgi:hypothetical protein